MQPKGRRLHNVCILREVYEKDLYFMGTLSPISLFLVCIIRVKSVDIVWMKRNL